MRGGSVVGRTGRPAASVTRAAQAGRRRPQPAICFPAAPRARAARAETILRKISGMCPKPEHSPPPRTNKNPGLRRRSPEVAALRGWLAAGEHGQVQARAPDLDRKTIYPLARH